MYTHMNQNIAFLVRPQSQQQYQARFPSQAQYQAQNQFQLDQNQFPPALNQFLAQAQMYFPGQNQPQSMWQQSKMNGQRRRV